MDKCLSIIFSGQTISDLLGHIVEKYVHMCHSRCATVDVCVSIHDESISRHSQCK